MGLRIIAVMPMGLRVAMEQILAVQVEGTPEHQTTGPLNQSRYGNIEGLNLATFFGIPEEQLNLTESVVFSFDVQDHLVSAEIARTVLENHGVISEIKPGPPPVENLMSTVVITDYPWFRLAFHPPASQMPD